MSIATELVRIQDARNTIRSKLTTMGLVSTTANLDNCASALNSIANNGAVSVQIKEGESYTIPAGYHNGSGTVAGIAGGGTYTLQAKSGIVPTKSQQNITSDDGYYGLSSVSIEAIPAIYQDVSGVTAGAGDVLANKIIVTADGTVTAGTMANNGSVALELDGTTTTSVSIPAGYHSGGGTVKLDNTIETALAAI